MDEEEEKAHKNIEKNGCHIMHIPANEDYPSITYSLGIEKTSKRPEVLVTGMDKDSAHFLINEYNARLKDGEIFEEGKFYADFLDDFEITFKIVDKKHYDHYFDWTQWYYDGDDFTALHFIWPDVNGAWPWSKKVNKDHRKLMPRLYAS